MAESIIVVNFKVESEAYKALADLKLNPINDSFAATQAVIVRKEADHVLLKDSYDTGAETGDDTIAGGLLGALIGVIGGPIGVLLCGSWGMLMGSTLDMADSLDNASLVEKVCECLPNESTSLIALVSEGDEKTFDKAFDEFDAEVIRFDAAEVAAEIEEAEELQYQMEKEARKKLRDDKKAERKEKIEEKRAEVKADFEAFKAKFKKKETAE